MHAYDPSSRVPYAHPIPGMRPSREHGTTRPTDRGSTTPIYDALYAEYRRSFRALPGDRTDEPETSEVLSGTGSWARTTASTGHWEVVGRQPYQAHSPLPALPPSPRDARPRHP
ncbi:hypothetical protein [Streptomyces sp. NPDC048196]|uniref:hypothetical protein n=1 Tax=Streptomyces sp. NPDC048196 TaxID=3154712 RepID=UPI0033E85744